jgi:hypothetical protein
MTIHHFALCALAVSLPMQLVRDAEASKAAEPPSWEVLPIPRYVDYGSPESFITPGKVAIVRHKGGPYETVRDENGELVGQSTIVEEELTTVLKGAGVADVDSVPDRLASYDRYDTLILLGSPRHNVQTAKYFDMMKLSFARWSDPHAPEDRFMDWKDFGREGYLLKVAGAGGKNIMILAGYDFDDARGRFYGAGTFYALQSLRQLMVGDRTSLRIKTAEIADKPLVAQRGYMTGWTGNADEQLRDVNQLARMKANNNIYWYGNSGYNPESASRWRYPWTSQQLAYFQKVGKFCRERFVTMNFCMNPDHYGVEWGAARSFDGKRKDPIHYDPGHGVEREFKDVWAKLGFKVDNDADIVASKYGQIHKVIPGEFARLQLWNEDDVFGLVHPEDKKLFQTETPDPRQNAIRYGRARGLLVARIYKRIRECYPDSPDSMPLCPPAGLHYHYCFETNAQFCRDFMRSLGETLSEQGVLQHIPCTDSGGGCSPEVLTCERMADFKGWYAGGPVLLHDDNFDLGRIGAYETDRNGARSYPQLNEKLPAGYRDKQLYKLFWGMTKNGTLDGGRVLCWCQAQYMWNMLGLDREKINALSVRKVTTEQSYRLLKPLCDEFSRPVCYTLDTQPPYRLLVVSDKIAFPAKEWQYKITFTETMRLECQRLRDKLNARLPEIEAKWENTSEKAGMLPTLFYRAAGFCSVYLAYGYVKGWRNDGTSPPDRLAGTRLRDLLLEADDIQERFFAGPDAVAGRITVVPYFYNGAQYFLHTNGLWKNATLTRADAEFYVDIWKDGLLGKFFEPVVAVGLSDVADGDSRLSGDWGKVQEIDKQKCRLITGEASIKLDVRANSRLLVRAKFGTDTTSTKESIRITLSAGETSGEEAVCKPRWVNWLLPDGKAVPQLTIKAEKPVRVYGVEVYRATEHSDRGAVGAGEGDSSGIRPNRKAQKAGAG